MTHKEKVDFLIKNIDGVGQVKAEKIAQALNVNTFFDILNNQELANKLRETVGVKLTQDIIEQLYQVQKQNSSVKTMVECGISTFSAINIAKNELLFDAFKKNPYAIGRRHGLKFEHCDKFAHILFCEGESPDMSVDRMHWFIESMLSILENSGHTFAYLQQLTKQINAYQKSNEYLPDTYLNSTLIPYLTHNDLVAVEKAKNIKKWRIYRKETANLENDIAYHIKRLSINKAAPTNQEFVIGNVNYDNVQLNAINSVKMSGLKVVTGPPGSGKTAVINGIINYFKQINPGAKIILCAPTGRAAKHMTEITGESSSTIHRLLGISEDRTFTRKTKLVCDMLICDEASMLNLDITFELLSRIETGTVVYFVGDKDQLPAVGPGNVLHDIIDSGVVPVYHLTKVYRQDGIILENAHKINQGKMPTKTSKQFQMVTFERADDLRQAAINWFQKYYDHNEPYETQILAPSYKTECGITALNEAIQQLNPEPYVFYSEPQYVGQKIVAYKKYDKILMTRNDKNGLYQNGSVGLFISNLSDALLVEFDGEEVTLPMSAVDDMTLGYAISVHKSQGSEYKHVLLCLPNKPVNMLKRNIAYTAATRAKNDLSIFEMTGALQTSVETNSELFKQTGMKDKIITIQTK